MKSQNIRFFLFAALVLLGMLLFNAWRQEHPSKSSKIAVSQNKTLSDLKEIDNKDIPQTISDNNTSKEVSEAIPKNREIHVKTDVYDLIIDRQGGDIIRLVLNKYAENDETFGKGFVLFDTAPNRYYIAQSGLTGEHGPDKRGVGRAQYSSMQTSYEMQEGQTELKVDLKTNTNGVDIIKRFIFHSNSYVIDMEYLIHLPHLPLYLEVLYEKPWKHHIK